jgi:hypothetical protein
MATFPTVTINGEEMLLIDASPDRGSPVAITVEIPTDVQRSESDRQTRTPLRRTPIHTLEMKLGVEDAAAAAWEMALATLGSKKVAVPVWVDARPMSDYANRLMDARYYWDLDAGEVREIIKPEDISGRQLHLEARAITGLADGDAVGSWEDLSGNGRHAVQATAGSKPIYKTGILNGTPVVRCDGVNDWMATTYADREIQTLLIVVKSAPDGVVDRVLGWGGPRSIGIFGALGGGAVNSWAWYASQAGGIMPLGGVITQWSTIVIRSTGSLLRPVVNGITAGSFDPYPSDSGLSLSLGAEDMYGTNPAPCDIAAVIGYDREITDAELTGLSNYIYANYLVGAVDTHRYAPLLVGYFEDRPDGRVIAPKAADYDELVIVQDSPETYPLIARRTNTPLDEWPEAATPDAESIVKVSKDMLKRSQVGRSGMALTEGTAAPMSWGQEADFLLQADAATNEIADMLSFFTYGAMGRVNAFVVPAWFAPHAEATPETPNAYKARFGEDKIRMEWPGPNNWCTLNTKLWQMPWELNPPVGESFTQARPAWLAKWVCALPETTLYWYYTEQQEPLVFDGNTYVPNKWEFTDIVGDMELGQSGLELTCEVPETHPLHLRMLQRLEAVLYVYLYECDAANPGEAELVFAGEVGPAKGAVTMKVTVRPQYSRQAPRYGLSRYDQFDQFSEEGGLLRANYERTAVVDHVNGYQVWLKSISGAATPAQYFADGIVEKGSGTAYEARGIVWHDYPGGLIKIDIERGWTNPPVEDDVIKLLPGYDGTWASAKAKWTATPSGYPDYMKFAGMPHLPPDQPSLPASDSDAGGKK